MKRMNAADAFTCLPSELLMLTLTFLSLNEASIFAKTSAEYEKFCKDTYMVTVNMYCLKMQNRNMVGLNFWLKYATCPNGLFLDNRLQAKSEYSFAPVLSDKYFQTSLLKHAKGMNTLVIRAVDLMHSSYLNMAQSTGRLLTLGEPKQIVIIVSIWIHFFVQICRSACH